MHPGRVNRGERGSATAMLLQQCCRTVAMQGTMALPKCWNHDQHTGVAAIGMHAQTHRMTLRQAPHEGTHLELHKVSTTSTSLSSRCLPACSNVDISSSSLSFSSAQSPIAAYRDCTVCLLSVMLYAADA